MSNNQHGNPPDGADGAETEHEAILVGVATEPNPYDPPLAQLAPPYPVPPYAASLPARKPRVWLPLGLFIATCFSTLWAGGWAAGVNVALQSGWLLGLQAGLIEGLKFAGPLMTILLCHEMGHWIQARRNHVYASYPYFIPMPISPFGTFGAVIAMDARAGDRRALFDIGITGPLAGLVPTLVCCVWGLYLSYTLPLAVVAKSGALGFGEPPLFKLLVGWILQPGPKEEVILHPLAFAGWVGLLITSLNLMPIGQLDGGHILYGLLRRKANQVSRLLMLAAIGAIAYFGLWHWMVMLVLLTLMGPTHPPTADDNVPLGPVRTVLGWLTLAFILIGFTPTPIIV